VIEYATKHLPRFNPISIASHYRDAGANPAEEAAYTIAGHRPGRGTLIHEVIG